MKNGYDKNKKVVIALLAVLAVCLAGGLCFYLAKLGRTEQPNVEAVQTETELSAVTVPEIETQKGTNNSEEDASEETESEPSGEAEGSPQTKEEPSSAGKPEEAAQSGEDKEADGTENVGQPESEASDAEAEKPQTKEEAKAPTETPQPVDTKAETNPEQPPQYEPEVTEPKQKPQEPAGGSTNESGQVYVPGFGYVDQPGAPKGETAGSDGDWDKQIGEMN